MPAEVRPAGIFRRRAIFVYYKLAAKRAPRLQQAFAALALPSTSWHLELMRRVDAGESADGLQTWMEIYRFDGEEQRDPALLRQLIETRTRDTGILALIDGDRHYEVFESCA